MSQFITENNVLIKYDGDDPSVTVPDGVAEIGNGAFSHNLTLKEITVPGSVKWISATAFYGCGALHTARISEGVTAIGPRAFVDCSSLTRLFLPNSIGMIYMMAFLNCSSLVEVSLPVDLRSVENCVFQNCASLTRINIPGGVVRLEPSAFYNCPSLTEILIRPQKLHLVNSLDPAFGAYARGCFAYSEQNALSDAEKMMLSIHAKRYVREIAPQLINHAPSVRYITDNGILGTKAAEKLLDKCVDPQCRAILINYLYENGGINNTADDKFTIL